MGATISVGKTPIGYTVTVTGRLEAADLKRLESACGPALEHKRIDLHIAIVDTGPMDAVVAAYLGRLEARGAVVDVGERRSSA